MTHLLTYAADLVNYYKNNDTHIYYGYYFILHYIRNEMICNNCMQNAYYSFHTIRSFRFNDEFSNNYSVMTACYKFIMIRGVSAS